MIGFLLIIFKDRIYLKLSPYKISILDLVNDGPPKSSMDNAFNQIRIIAVPYIYFISSLTRTRLDV